MAMAAQRDNILLTVQMNLKIFRFRNGNQMVRQTIKTLKYQHFTKKKRQTAAKDLSLAEKIKECQDKKKLCVQ